MEATDVLAIRPLTYAFLARAYFEEIDQGTLEGLCASGVLEEFPVDWDADAYEEMRQGLKLMANWVQAAEKTDLNVLAADFARLFHGSALFSPPFESAYRSEEHLLLCEETIEVRDFYHQYGFQQQERLHLPDDHVGLELEFLALLGRQATEATETSQASECLRASRQFLREHVQAWVPEFVGDVVHNAETDFYRGLALFTRGFLQLDNELLRDLPSIQKATKPEA